MSQYNYTLVGDIDRLTLRLKNSVFVDRFTRIDLVSETEMGIFMSVDLDVSDQSALTAIYNEHVYQTTVDAVTSAVIRAMEFGRSIVIDYGVKNILRGYTAAQVMEASVALSGVRGLLMSGALHSAKTAIAALPEEGIVTSDDKAEFTAKIDAYLETV